MNTASLELCKELYELSGWEVQPIWEFSSAPDPAFHYNDKGEFVCYKYDLGFLLRKLPAFVELTRVSPEHKEDWLARYFYEREGSTSIPAPYHLYADTPEDAVCKLAIELFKQGVLKK